MPSETIVYASRTRLRRFFTDVFPFFAMVLPLLVAGCIMGYVHPAMLLLVMTGCCIGVFHAYIVDKVRSDGAAHFIVSRQAIEVVPSPSKTGMRRFLEELDGIVETSLIFVDGESIEIPSDGLRYLTAQARSVFGAQHPLVKCSECTTMLGKWLDSIARPVPSMVLLSYMVLSLEFAVVSVYLTSEKLPSELTFPLGAASVLMAIVGLVRFVYARRAWSQSPRTKMGDRRARLRGPIEELDWPQSRKGVLSVLDKRRIEYGAKRCAGSETVRNYGFFFALVAIPSIAIQDVAKLYGLWLFVGLIMGMLALIYRIRRNYFSRLLLLRCTGGE